jgi:hypothetical protein
MTPLSYRRHRFPPSIIQHAIWLYLRVTLSYRDVEDLLAERGLQQEGPRALHSALTSDGAAAPSQRLCILAYFS